MASLPTEIWQIIMLSNPSNYYALALTCRSFRVDVSTAKSAMTTILIANDKTEYRLPNGWLHRDDDLPAEIWVDGTQFWYRDGKRHRDNDLPAEIRADGSQLWYRDGKRHRDDKPAIIYADGSQEWYQDGVKIR